MKNTEIKQLSVEQIQAQIAESQRLLGSLKFSHAISPIENPMAIRNTRRLIARLLTELRARQTANQK
jgi:large subunit ribosomal protein L29